VITFATPVGPLCVGALELVVRVVDELEALHPGRDAADEVDWAPPSRSPPGPGQTGQLVAKSAVGVRYTVFGW
jgi:hypothetical protein